MDYRINHDNGVQSHIIEEDGKLHLGTVQDCSPILEKAKAMANEGMHGTKDMRLAATLPNVVIETYCNNNGITFQEWMSNPIHIKRMLNDPDLSGFRIWKGRV